jgi:hypothetical protein
MDETEWLTHHEDPLAMIRHVGRKASQRRRRLFAAACCRRIWHLLDSTCRDAVVVAERFADGAATADELAAAQASARARAEELLAGQRDDDGAWAGNALCSAKAGAGSGDGAVNAAIITARAVRWAPPQTDTAGRASREAAERAAQCDVVRDIFGNPFRRFTAKTAWLTSTVAAMTLEVYESQDFTPMPILADALQDAGCQDEQFLSHCRGAGTHVRGCWVIDLLLAKK